MIVKMIPSPTNPRGRRVYIIKRRLHHGFTGCIFVALGTILALHDRRDWREWIPREVLK